MRVSLFSFVAMTCFAEAKRVSPPMFRKSDIDSKEWMTLENGVEFHAVQHLDPNLRQATHRLLNKNGNSVYDKQSYLDGSESYYDVASQAWRLLGFYVDCNSLHDAEDDQQANYNNGNQNEDYRDLEENDAYDTLCTRYLLWAAYIDPEYQGGGVDEYQQYDTYTGSWSDCDKKAERCAKMDCHESSTNFKLLGVFKEPNIGNWISQLTPHQGSCVWSSDVKYKLGYGKEVQDQSSWPLSCTRSNMYDKDGNFLYYHTKPLTDGKVTVGLYTESSCREEYEGSVTVEAVLSAAYDGYEGNNNEDEEEEQEQVAYEEEYEEAGQYDEEEEEEVEEYGEQGDDNSWYWQAYNYYMNGNDDGGRMLEDAAENEEEVKEANEEEDEEVNLTLTLYQAIDEWNDALDDFKVCRPCKSWSVEDMYACKDASGAIGVNQCTLFATNTNMYSASFHDVELASDQGFIVSFVMDGIRFGHGGYSSGPCLASVIFFATSLVILGVGVFMFRRAKKEEAAASTASLQQPLVSEPAPQGEGQLA